MAADLRLAERPKGEGYPPTLRRQRALFAQLDGAIDEAELVIARHFRAFATAMRAKLPLLVTPFAQFALDEYADAVDEVLRPELEQLSRELTITASITTRRVLQIGAAQAQEQLGGIVIDWDIDQPEVDRFLKKHVLELAKNLDDTTRERLATVIRRGVREGQSVAQIEQAIMESARRMSVARARLIAQSEVINAFAEGSMQVYQTSGIVQAVMWLDGQAGACELCRALHRKIVPLGGEFAPGITRPTRHPGCRCSLSPVLEIPK